MEMGVLGFVLLLLVPGLVQAQTSTPCSAPRIDAGFFLPLQESYSHGTKINYACDDGYKPPGKGWWGTSICIDGEWFGIPICVESLPVCSEPPKRLNAIIINQRYQEVFSLDTEVEYQCKDGYTTEQGATNKSVFCRAGGWTEGPTCTPSTRLGTKVTEPSYISIDNCGTHPLVPNGEPLVYRRDQLKYTCNRYYKLVGPEIVRCRSDSTWSELPTCKVNYCLLRNGAHEELKLTKDEYILNNEQKEFECLSEKYYFQNYSVVRCIDQKLHVSRCCTRAQINLEICKNSTMRERSGSILPID